jgi:hypothetical protein
MTTAELVRINKDYFVKTATVAAKTAIFVAFPYLKIPPLNLLIDQGISWMVKKIADGLELSAFFIFVDFRVDAQGKDYVLASHNANNNPTEENMRIADEKFKIFASFKSL